MVVVRTIRSSDPLAVSIGLGPLPRDKVDSSRISRYSSIFSSFPVGEKSEMFELELFGGVKNVSRLSF